MIAFMLRLQGKGLMSVKRSEDMY